MISIWNPVGVYSIPDRGPREPPPLGCYVEWRPESSPRCWFAMWADGTVAAMCTSSEQAQQAIGRGNVKGASNG